MATAVTRYLDPAAAGTGDGSSWANAYTSYSAALAAIRADYPDFTAADVAVTLMVRGSNSWSSGSAGNLDFGNTSQTCYFRLKGEEAAATGALWSAAAPTIASNDWEAVLPVMTGAVIVEDLQIHSTATSGMNAGVEWLSGTYLRVERCKIRSAQPDVDASHVGVSTDDNPGTGKTLVVANCVVDDYYVGMDLHLRTGDHFIVYNNTLLGTGASTSNDGFFIDGNGVGTLRLKNNIVTGYARYDIGNIQSAATMDFANNATEDDTGDNIGTGGRANQTFTFVDAANGDYHLAAGDTGALGHGTNLSADPHYPLTTDLDGDTRDTPWDIGAAAFTTVADSEPLPSPAVATEGALALAGRWGGFEPDPGSFMVLNTHPSGHPVSYTIVTPVAHGTLAAHVGGALDYTPDTDFVGEDSFTYTVHAADQDSSLGTITFLVEDRFEAVALQAAVEVQGFRPAFQQPFAFAAQAEQGELALAGLVPVLSEGVIGEASILVHGELPSLHVGVAPTAQQGALLFYNPLTVIGEPVTGAVALDADSGLIDLRNNDGIDTGAGPSGDGAQLDRPPVTVHLWLTRPTKVKLRR